MPFQIKDETSGQILFFIDNVGQLGLGSLPANGSKITILGAAVLDSNARFADGTLKPGVPAAYYGSLFVPAFATANVGVSTAAPPAVTSAFHTNAVTTTTVSFENNTAGDATKDYSIW
jgi:hypothetical protein